MFLQIHLVCSNRGQKTFVQTMYHERKFLKLVLCLLLLNQLEYCTSVDTLTPNQPLKDGVPLISEGQVFALGFFSIGNSSSRYLGIRYNTVSGQTIVWVANRGNPITDNSGVLSIDETGNLVLHCCNRTMPLWSTNVSVEAAAAQNSSAQVLDVGNFVLYEGNRDRTIAWQSFDHPTNTYLPYMKLGIINRRTGLNRFLTSWKSQDNPGVGQYSQKIKLTGVPQLFLYEGSVPIWRTGPWVGIQWSGVPNLARNVILNNYTDTDDEISIMYGTSNPLILTRLVLTDYGILERLTWHEDDGRWVSFWSAPVDRCDTYSHCGVFGYCDPNKNAEDFECSCFAGFQPRLAHDWSLRDGSKGCIRNPGVQVCQNGEGFVKLENAKVPDTSNALVDESLDIKACEKLCLSNCSCTAYANANISSQGSGCMTWYGDLNDTRLFSNWGQDLYIRVDAAELALYAKKSKSSHGKAMKIALSVSPVVLLLMLSLAFWKWQKGKRERSRLLFNLRKGGKEMNTDLQFFDIRTISAASDNFSAANKLGEGGFGSVYKGRLHNGQEIAIKRLSKNSVQGDEEFKNEVTLIAKLQHRNLVRLLGCCVQREEKILLYEYLPNNALDSFIFDGEKGKMLDWNKRYEIIKGIVRAMIYLHQDSILRIIHRDLKASNVLLDATLNPKLSDFGMARIFGGDQIKANTRRVVGTYGYMAPEYAMEGIFSVKSDVFSFGILLLEIISGRKNSSYYQEKCVNLIGQVWDLWRDGNTLDVVDSSLGDSYEPHQVLRCINVGLLCVQELPNDRPTMPEVGFMLSNDADLPFPKRPAFIFILRNTGPNSSSADGANSVNDMSLTIIEAR